jgi:hypothetical protein
VADSPGSWRRDAWLALALFVLAFALSGWTRDRAQDGRLASDEPEWIAISILHWRQFVLGEPSAGAELDEAADPERPWESGVQRTTFGYMNPCLPKLVWGGVLFASGHREASPLAFQTFHRSDPARGVAAQQALLPAESVARRVVIVFSCASAVLLFFVARELCVGRAGWVAGALAYGLWFASPLVQRTSGYLRTDPFMLPFCLAALWVALRVPRASLASFAALGALGGLALASKLNGGLVLAATAGWSALWIFREPERRGAILAGLALAVLLAGLIFFALDPRLWSGPLDGVRDILARWDKLLRFFQDDLAPRTHVEVARTLGERASLFVRKLFGRDDPLRPLGAVLALGGTIVLAWRAFRGPKQAAAGVALVFVAVFALGTLAWLPLDWERFYLTALPGLLLLEAVPVAALVERWIARSAHDRVHT